MAEAPLDEQGKILPAEWTAVAVNNGTAAGTATPPDSAVWQLSQLPEDVLYRISSCLDDVSLLRLSQANKFHHSLCRQNQSGWEALCDTVWQEKVHVCQKARDHVKQSAMEAYRMAWEDAHTRQHVRLEEFCYNPETHQGTVWSFRFKESAGVSWTSVDPWYQALPCRQMVFLPGGKVQQYVVLPENGQQHCVLMDPPAPMTWRFITRPMDLPCRVPGSYVRLTKAGRDLPTYSVRRSPNHNWGFIMESCWGLYASFPLPPRRQQLVIAPLSTPVNDFAWLGGDYNENAAAEPEAAAAGASTNSRSSGGEQPVMEQYDPLQDDSKLVIASGREAFLYNAGARMLPEGDLTIDEFERAWVVGP